jgi:hypothetical protein
VQNVSAGEVGIGFTIAALDAHRQQWVGCTCCGICVDKEVAVNGDNSYLTCCRAYY